MRLALAALLALTGCATASQNCALATATALALDVGGSWTPEAHYADAGEVCGAADLTFQASPADPSPRTL